MNKLYSVLISQYVSEKSNFVCDKYNKVIFRVSKKSNKYDIKCSVEKIFNVFVKSINVINMQGKVKSFKGKNGVRSSWKKAIVHLKDGYSINFSEFE